MSETKAKRLLSLNQVRSRVTLSRSSIYAKAKSNDFPAPIKISENRVAWDEDEIDRWIAEKIKVA